MKQVIFTGCAILALTLVSCGNSETKSNGTTSNEQDTVQVAVEEKEEKTIVGLYTLTDMIPVTDGKVLTKQDKEYIEDSKKRTIGNTTLTLNDDGTFKRVFPHPSGDGTESTWTGTYVMNEEKGTLDMQVEMNGKKMPINFTIVEWSLDKLSIKTDFGQIFMTYVYTKTDNG